MIISRQQVNKYCCQLFPFFEWVSLVNGMVLRKDLVAGIVAGVLILPQAIALATLAGMPPEYGLYTSIFPVIIACLFGSSWHSLAGPNTAVVIMIAVAVSPYASVGTPDYIAYVLTLSFMVGVIQMSFAIFKMGSVFNYFSHTVLVAIVTAVGIIIIIQQVGNFLGILMNIPEDIDFTFIQIFNSLPLANGYAVTVGLVTVVSGVVSKHFYPKWPYLIVAVVVGTLSAIILDLMFGEANTHIDKLGNMSLSILPLSAPDFSPENFAEAAEGLIPAAVMIALMGLIQSTVIARAMAVNSGQSISMNQEVMGQGLSNVVGSFLSCFPSCGSFNRSASNLETGAVTPLAGIFSAFALAMLVYFATPLVALLPIPVMAGILFHVGWGLIKVSDIKKLMFVRGYGRIVFVVCLATTLYGGLQDGVFLGAFLSIAMYLSSVSKPEVEMLFTEESVNFHPQGHSDCTVIRISGSLFFGSIQMIENVFVDLAKQDGRKNCLIIDGEYIQDIDKSAADAFILETSKRRQQGGDFYLSLRNHQLDPSLIDHGIVKAMGEDHISYQSE